MIVAQITDPHISLPGSRLYGGYDPDGAFSSVLAHVAALNPRPDLVVLSGDLTENGTPEEYAHFRALIAGFDLPLAAIPGNHDRRDAFAEAFAGTAVTAGVDPSWLSIQIDLPGLTVLGLDTLGLEGEAGGTLDEARLDWLGRRLADAGATPVLLFMHHPPFATGIVRMDRWGLADPGDFTRLVAAAPTVLRVCCGHVHRAIEAAYAGTIAGVCPPVAWSVPLFRPEVPVPLIPSVPGFQLHCWEAGRGLVTHTEFLRPEASS